MTPDENSKLTETSIGLLNLSEDFTGGVYKIKLQLGDLASYSFYDGEVVVIEGFHDSTNAKINVIRVHKP